MHCSWLFGRAVFAGVADPRPRLDALPQRLIDVGIYFFGQKKVVEDLPILPVYFERAVLAVRKDVDMGPTVNGTTLLPSLWPRVNIEVVDKRGD